MSGMDNFRELLEYCRNNFVYESGSVVLTQITDMSNKLVAILAEDQSMIELRDPVGKPIGRYIKASNTTVDMFNKALAKGNILMSLLKMN